LANQSSELWAIDLKWYDENQRSFVALVHSCLCSSHGRLGAEHSVEYIIKTVRGCCSRSPRFLDTKTPLLEVAFRLLLAQGNEPMTLEDMREKLVELRGSSNCPPLHILARLLENDSYYGIRRARRA
jgi:hypothetical protein